MGVDLPNSDESSVIPLHESNPALCSELLEEFRRLVRTHLTDDELPSFEGILYPPRFDTAVIDGNTTLRLTFHGGRTCVGWDGSAEEARNIVSELAEVAAANISGDHWINGDGWQQRTSFGDIDDPSGPTLR